MRGKPKALCSTPLTLEQVTGIPKERHEGVAIVCSKCGLAGHTLVKDGKDGYRHQTVIICEQVRRNQIC